MRPKIEHDSVMTGDSRLRVPSLHFVLPVCRFCIRRSSVSRLCTYGMNALLGETDPPFLSSPSPAASRPLSPPSFGAFRIAERATLDNLENRKRFSTRLPTTIIRRDSPNSSRRDTRLLETRVLLRYLNYP